MGSASSPLSAVTRTPPDADPPRKGRGNALADLVVVQGGAQPDIRMLELDERLPLAGHTASLSMPAIYELIRAAQDDAGLRQHAPAGGVHVPGAVEAQRRRPRHRAPSRLARRRRSAAGSRRRWRRASCKAVVCTATLDLGIDWGDVDLVVNVGAPKGASRIMQRIGRSNHRMDEPSKAYLVPANRFEILECRAALDAVHEAAQDTPDARIGALDVLVPAHPRHGLRRAVRARGALRRGASRRRPMPDLTWEDFEAVRRFRRDRRLRAARLRALRQDRARARTGSGACATRGSRSNTG